MKQFFYPAIISVFCFVLNQPGFAQENLINKQINLDKKVEKLNSDASQLDDNKVQAGLMELFTNSGDNLLFSLDSIPEADIENLVSQQPQGFEDAPLNPNLISEEEIEEFIINHFQDIAKQMAKHSYSPKYERGNSLSNYILMQGLRDPKFLFPQERVAFYIDDIPVDYNNVIILSSGELEKIEVVGTPQSTLIGKNSPGGAVNAISRQASSEPEVIVGASYGKYNSRELQFSLNDALVEDKLALRIAGVYQGRDGFIQNIATDEKIGEKKRFAARGTTFMDTYTRLANIF